MLAVNGGGLRGPAQGEIQPVGLLCGGDVLGLLGALAAGNRCGPAGEVIRPCGGMIAVLIGDRGILLYGDPYPESSYIHEKAPSRIPNNSDLSVRVRSW